MAANEMEHSLFNSAFSGVMITLAAYGLGAVVRKRLRFPLCNPLLLSIAITMVFLWGAHIEYRVYRMSTGMLDWLLTPATVCLAIPLYEKMELLKKNWKALAVGIVSGVMTSLVCVSVLCVLFRLSHKEYVTLLPKSITTAMGMGVSEALGGYSALTVAVIIITGIVGNVFAEMLFRVCRIHLPLARGVALGTASHAIGTAKAMELGRKEGSVSSLALVVSGLLTVILTNFAARFF